MPMLENIVGSAVNSRLGRFLLASAVAATMYACDGRATPIPIEPARPTQAADGLFVNFPFSVASANYDGNTGLLQGNLTLKNTAPHTFATQYRTIVLDNNGNLQRASDWATTPQFASFDPNEVVSVPFSIDNAEQGTNFMVQIRYEINGESRTFNYTREAIERNFGPIGFVVPIVTPTATAVATATPTITPTPTLEAKLFEFVFPSGTPEQYKTFSENALEDYRKVLGVYGINEEDARLKVEVAKDESYSFNFKLGNKSGTHGWTGFDSFTTSRIKFRHEVTHVINNTLFVKDSEGRREPWYNTFNEGSAKYASGEVEAGKTGGSDFKKDDGSLTTIVGNQAILDYLIANPNKFWERIDFQVSPFNSPGHLTGAILYWLLEHEDLTPEKHTVALQKLAEYYKNPEKYPDIKTNKERIQSAYEFALDKKLGYLFNDWLQPGINRFYAIATPTPTPR